MSPSDSTVAERGHLAERTRRPPFAAVERALLRSPSYPKSHSNPTTPPATPLAKPGGPPSADDSIPGYPIVHKNTEIAPYISGELLPTRLDQAYLHLWWAGRPGNIQPLHVQKVMRREIVLNEDVNLHLVWFDTTYYVKPLPEWMLDFDFYVRVMCEDDKLWKAANGFLRTYTKMVQHPSDFRIAKELGLLPESVGSWEEWSGIVKSIKDRGGIANADVSKRYHYGALRLRRLNHIYRVFRRENFHSAYLQYDQFFSKNFAWLVLFVAYLSVVLSAMQVVLGTSMFNGGFEDVSYWVSIAALVFIAATIGLQFLLLVALFVYHLVCTILNLEKKGFPWIGSSRRKAGGPH